MGPRGRLLCQLWDHPAWLRTAAGFRFARPLYCADELPGSVGVWPDALADDFRTHASFQGAAGRLRVGGVVPSKERYGTAAAAARRSNRCRIVCPDAEGVRHEGEHVVAGVIVGSKELPLGVMSVPAMCRAPRGSSDQCRSLCRRCGSCRLLCPAPGPDDHGFRRACKPSLSWSRKVL